LSPEPIDLSNTNPRDQTSDTRLYAPPLREMERERLSEREEREERNTLNFSKKKDEDWKRDLKSI
jgi:hypothetical protein